MKELHDAISLALTDFEEKNLNGKDLPEKLILFIQLSFRNGFLAGMKYKDEPLSQAEIDSWNGMGK